MQANHDGRGHWLLANSMASGNVHSKIGVKRTPLLSGEPDYFGRNKISSGGDLSHYSSASLY